MLLLQFGGLVVLTVVPEQPLVLQAVDAHCHLLRLLAGHLCGPEDIPQIIANCPQLPADVSHHAFKC
jgi:hypothetical protein